MSNPDTDTPKPSLIGLASALGAPDFADTRGAAAAPQSLRDAGLLAAIRRHGLAANWDQIFEAPTGERLPALAALLRTLADKTAASVEAGLLPIVIGGDHAIAAGTWRGVGRALGQAPGLIWIDAHLDAHTPESSPSGNPHGMPLAALLGFGSPAMTALDGPALDPHRIAVIGVRSFETAEADLLQRLGVRVFTLREINRRSLAVVFADALAIAGCAGRPFGVSIDLDAIDPQEAPGVTTPVAGGLKGNELGLALRGLLRHRQLVAFEIAEYSPIRDRDGMTAQLALALIASASAELQAKAFPSATVNREKG